MTPKSRNPIKWLSGVFETWIDPFRARTVEQPPMNIWAFLWFYLKQAKAPYVLLMIIGGLVALFEALFFYFMGRLVDILESSNAALGWDGLLASHGTELVVMLVVVVLGRFVMPALNALVEEQTIGRGFTSLVRWQTYAYVARQSMRFFSDDFSGRLVTKVSQVAGSLTDFIAGVLQVVWFLLIYTGTTMVLFAALDWRMVVLVAAWIIIFGLLAWYFVPRMRSRAAENAEAASTLNGRVTDSFSNIQTLRLFGTSDDNDRYVRDGFERFLYSSTRLARMLTGARAALGLLSAVMITCFGFLSIQLWVNGAISVGAVAFALGLILRLNMMLGRLMGQLNGLMRHFGTIQNAMETIARPLELVDAPNAKKLIISGAEIKFDNVSFKYSHHANVISDINLHIKAGERVGLVGHSGAGKSTLVSLLLRFYDIEEGKISIDGQDISKVTQESLRANIGVVSQDTSLLHRTVRGNIMFGREDATEEDLIAAAKGAEAYDFIMDLVDSKGNKGFDAQVGERGVKLSGGQRQRVAIARVLLKNAPILVLDEATSALDSEVEAAIQSKLDTLMAGKTVIAIAHRLSTIAAMDWLVVMERGRIVEQGSHEQLIAQNGSYARLWARQSGGFLNLDADEDLSD